MPAVAFVLGNPVPHGALGEAGVGLLLACGDVGDLCPVHHPLGHAVSGQWALSAPPVAVASSTWWPLVSPAHFCVVLAHLLRHVGHGGVRDLHSAPVDHLPQLVVWGKAGVEKGEELLSDVGGDGLGVGGVEPGNPPGPRLAAGFGGCWLLVGKLVVVASLVQGLLVRGHHSQELLLAAGESAEPPVYLQGDVFEDAGWMV